MSEKKVEAWILESGLWVVYGTHNPKKAGKAMEEYLIESGWDDVQEKPTRADLVAEFQGPDVQRHWTRPVEDEQPFERLVTAGPNRTPYMTVYGDW
jgi:hypothetical protein